MVVVGGGELRPWASPRATRRGSGTLATWTRETSTPSSRNTGRSTLRPRAPACWLSSAPVTDYQLYCSPPPPLACWPSSAPLRVGQVGRGERTQPPPLLLPSLPSLPLLPPPPASAASTASAASALVATTHALLGEGGGGRDFRKVNSLKQQHCPVLVAGAASHVLKRSRRRLLLLCCRLRGRVRLWPGRGLVLL